MAGTFQYCLLWVCPHPGTTAEHSQARCIVIASAVWRCCCTAGGAAGFLAGLAKAFVRGRLAARFLAGLYCDVRTRVGMASAAVVGPRYRPSTRQRMADLGIIALLGFLEFYAAHWCWQR